MVMSEETSTALVKKYLPEWRNNREEIDQIDRWYRGKLTEADKPKLPKRYTSEYKELRDRAIGRWLGLVVTSVAQILYVEGYHRSDESENASAWKVWQANRLDGRQIAIHRGALAHGISYATVLPGTRRGEPMPKISGKSARRMMALYEDPADDEWPLYALEAETIRKGSAKVKRVKLYDAEAVFTFDADDTDQVTYIEFNEHGAGVCPVVRYTNMLDLDGRATGEVEPFIDLAARIDQDMFDRLVVQRFGAWTVRTISGMEIPSVEPQEGETEDDAQRRALLKLSMLDFLVSDDVDTKFGSLPPTPLDGYIRAGETDVRQLAAVSQTPSHVLTGDLVNLSPEALAAAAMGETRKGIERKHTLGESHEQMLRLGAHLMGDEAGAADDDAQVHWADLESRSLAQVADALGKLSQMLGVPPQALWERIPGVTQTDVDSWKQMVSDDDAFGGLLRDLAGANQSTEDPAAIKAKADAMGVLIRSGVEPIDAARQVGLSVTFTGAVPTSLRLPESEASDLEPA